MQSADIWSVLTKVGLAILILIVTWILASIVKWAIGKLVTKIPALQRDGSDGRQIGKSIGQIGGLIIWLLGLIAVLQLFNLDQVLSPLQGLLDGIFGFLPNIIGAGFIFFIGFVFAKIAKQLVQTALNAVDLTKLTSKFRSFGDRATGVAETATGTAPQQNNMNTQQAAYGQPQQGYQGQPGQQGHPGAGNPNAEANAKISSLVGNLVFGIIIIVVSISALQVLGIAAISQPAQQMLEIFLNAIPLIIAAGILLAIGVVIAKFLGNLLEEVLRGVGTDRAVDSIGIVPESTSASSVITKIVQVAIMIFFAIMATRLLWVPRNHEHPQRDPRPRRQCSLRGRNHRRRVPHRSTDREVHHELRRQQGPALLGHRALHCDGSALHGSCRFDHKPCLRCCGHRRRRRCRTGLRPGWSRCGSQDAEQGRCRSRCR